MPKYGVKIICIRQPYLHDVGNDGGFMSDQP